MRRLLLFLVLLAVVAMAQTPDLKSTLGQLNGVWWNATPANERVTFVMGFWNGMLAIGTPGYSGSLQGCATYVKDWPVTNGIDKSMGEIMREIDKFYQNPINLPLPVMISAMYSPDEI